MTKLAPEWVRTSDPLIRSPARYRWTKAPAGCSGETICTVVCDYDENYVYAGINATSQEVFSTCKPFGVIV